MARHCAILALLAGCSDPATGADASVADVGSDVSADDSDARQSSLIDHELWQVVSAAADSFDDRPDTVDCEQGSGWAIEPLEMDFTVGINTNSCNYLGLVQPTLRALAPGEELSIQLWHFELAGAGPVHMGVAIDGDVVWEKTTPFPASSELVDENFAVPDGAAKGAPIVFHLHNHGLNSYNLIRIDTPY